MGVPKFYRWISERYPCLSEVLKEYQLPEFDNLYLDMNGIIHVCSHPEDDNPHFRITEEKIFTDIFHYIEVLFRMIKPRKVFFMAVDGVAPRAKMNQQRGRRFRSAREAEEREKQAVSKGETLPTEQRFDSNCITPGTEFMVKLHEQLTYFVAKKVSTDRLWQGLRIYLSGHETPGEGEHKVMDFIRSEKSQPNYDENTRHCLYGLDADLIMLGLTTHEPHFSLLREEVRFTGKNSQKRSTAPEETTFHLLHLSLMREYLEFEFGEHLRSKLSFEYSLERIIDDWVLMGFLVGNDFIPNLPHIHIHQDCLPLLWETYKTVLPTLDGYLNEDGFLNLPRFEKYLTALAQYDISNFQEKYADLKWAAGKRKKMVESASWPPGDPPDTKSFMTSSLSSDMVGIPTADEFMKHKEEFDATIDNGSDDLNAVDGDAVNESADEEDECDDDDDDDDSDSPDSDREFRIEFKKYKAHYYTDKMDFERVTQKVLESQAHGYVKAIQWILHYYYNGVQSWSWYYPHHYAPYLSDVKGFSDLKLKFELAQPFLPFQQLMAVLPTASKSLLPQALQGLMVEDSSPVKDYYPIDFETDLNGKLQEWEAVVLIPFIDEERLLNAMEPCLEWMTDSERARNKHGPHLLYEYVAEPLEPFTSMVPGKLPDIAPNHAKLTEIHQNGFVIPIECQRKGLCSGAKLDVYFPGFPTLKHLKHQASLQKAEVKVFQMNSRNDNMILELQQDTEPPALQQAAAELIGRSVFVGWPHLYEALVESVAVDEMRYCSVEIPPRERTSEEKTEIRREPLSLEAQSIWQKEADTISERYKRRMGVEIGDTLILVYGRPMCGRRYVCGQHGLVTLEKQWQSRPTPFAYQTIVTDITVQDPNFTQFKTLDQLFQKKSMVFCLGKPNYGASGEVLDVDLAEGRVRANFQLPYNPSLNGIIRHHARSQSRYYAGYSLAQRLGISSHILSRITGTIYIMQGTSQNAPKLNAGLNLKFNKTNKEVPGYTHRVEREWTYSDKVCEILSDYMSKFPEVFDCIVKLGSNNDCYYEDDVFPTNKAERVAALAKYLKALPSAEVAPSPMGTVVVDDAVVKLMEEEVVRANLENKKKRKVVKMQVRPHLLYQPLDAQANSVPDPLTSYELFDRVVNVREGYSVPLGLRGTVIGISPAEKEQDSVYEVLFDEEFLGGLTIRGSTNRAYRMPHTSMINITFGEERRDVVLRQQKQSASAGAMPQHPPQTLVFHNRTSRPVANGNAKQQQQQPVYKVLQHPRHLESSSPGHPQVTHPAQETAQTNTGSQDFRMLWDQLQQGPRPPNLVTTQPRGPHVNGRLLCPPPAWLKQRDSGATTTSAKSDTNSVQNLSRNSNLVTSQQSTKNVETVLSELLKSAEMHDRREAVTGESASDGSSYRRQLTVEDLFKGAEETQRMKSVSSNAPSTAAHAKTVAGTGHKTSEKETAVTKSSSVLSGTHQKTGAGASGHVQAPGSSYHRPIRPTQVEPSAQDLHASAAAKQTKPKQQPQQQQPPYRPPMHNVSQARSSVQHLAVLGQSLGVRMPPLYDHHWSVDGRCHARVVFDNMTFAGSVARTREQAEESAASHALFNLQHNVMGRPSVPAHVMPTHFGSASSSAFTPVQSYFGRPPGPFMYGVGPAQRGFGLQPHGWRPPFQFAGHAALPVSRPPLSVGPRLGPDAAATQRPPITQQSTAGQQGMQFVPTQVLRRQKTPQKQDGRVVESTDASTAAVLVNDLPTVTGVGSLATPSASAAVSAELPLDGVSCAASPAATAACSATDVTDTATKSKTPQTRKARSRIAANFGALNSQS